MQEKEIGYSYPSNDKNELYNYYDYRELEVFQHDWPLSHKIKTMFSYVSLGLGLMLVLTSFGAQEQLSGVLATIIIGCAFLLPGAWYLYAEKQDEKIRQRFLDDLYSFKITGQSPDLLAKPNPFKRGWGNIFLIFVAILCIGAGIAPDLT